MADPKVTYRVLIDKIDFRQGVIAMICRNFGTVCAMIQAATSLKGGYHCERSCDSNLLPCFRMWTPEDVDFEYVKNGITHSEVDSTNWVLLKKIESRNSNIRNPGSEWLFLGDEGLKRLVRQSKMKFHMLPYELEKRVKVYSLQGVYEPPIAEIMKSRKLRMSYNCFQIMFNILKEMSWLIMQFHQQVASQLEDQLVQHQRRLTLRLTMMKQMQPTRLSCNTTTQRVIRNRETKTEIEFATAKNNEISFKSRGKFGKSFQRESARIMFVILLVNRNISFGNCETEHLEIRNCEYGMMIRLNGICFEIIEMNKMETLESCSLINKCDIILNKCVFADSKKWNSG